MKPQLSWEPDVIVYVYMQVCTKFTGIFFHKGSQIKLFCNIVHFADENLKQTHFVLTKLALSYIEIS